ncbi:MAG: Multifunctional alkaline phosphatase superfamily protein PehA [Anaerolineales bacterium]|nr:Multifunctional alkaline phosphatase superfamily protein PehA [Anaerolineales bacterium]
MQAIRKLFLLACAVCLAGCGAPATTSPAPTVPHEAATSAANASPNILYILTDDMAASDLQYMPKTLELLGAQGITFDNFFVSMALCCPSRACMLRGQYPHNTQIVGNNPPDGGFEKFNQLGLEESTLAVWLQEAGYNTALIGKYLNGYPGNMGKKYIPPGWTEWYSSVEGSAYDQYNYTLNENGTLVAYGDAPEDYGTDVYAAKTTDFMARSVAEGKPFFAYVSVYAPHSPATPAPRHENLFADLTLPRPPSFNEEEIGDKPQALRGNPLLRQRGIRNLEQAYRKRIQSLQAVDEMIANFVTQLETLGQLDNTYIVFTADNGYHLGEHRLPQGKNTPYEEDIRVPLLVRGPNVEAGAVVEALAGNIDLAPTFAELAGISAPAFVDGRSLVPFLRGETPSNWREAFLLERGSQSAQTSRNIPATPDPALEAPDSPLDRARAVNYAGLRTAEYTYVEYANGEIELYDLRADPYQLQNIAGAADPSLLAVLHEWLESLRQCQADSCREAEMQP